jgi:WD40 repeat protein
VDGIIIPTKRHNKKSKKPTIVNQLRYVQSIHFSKLPTWVMRFHCDNKYLATGGQDGVLRIWEVLPAENDEDHLVLFKSEPIREYKQHTKDIVDISWGSKDKNTILTASNDKQVILWNIEDEKALQIYTHPDLVT